MNFDKFNYLEKIKNLYSEGGNIIQYLKNLSKTEMSSLEDILISYDFQAGSYIKDLEKNRAFKESYVKSLLAVTEIFEDFDSIMEVGVGEATTLSPLLSNLGKVPKEVMGFDISWSRLKFAKEFLKENRQSANLFTANLFQIPLSDNSVDVVYTSHSIEPNGGRENEALQELYRVTNSYLVLLEPSFEFGGSKARERMIKNGYVKNLYQTAIDLGYKIVEHRLFDYYANPLNPTGLIVIQKEKKENPTGIGLKCPITLTRLEKSRSFLYSRESMLAYPIMEEIPCLLKENSILASHFLTDYKKWKDGV